jgi:hypothetical protein
MIYDSSDPSSPSPVMAKDIMRRLRVAAGKRAKNLQAVAEKAADGLLSQTYAGTAQQALRGAEAVTEVTHKNEKAVAKAKRSLARSRAAKKTTTKPRHRSKRPAARPLNRRSKKR